MSSDGTITQNNLISNIFYLPQSSLQLTQPENSCTACTTGLPDTKVVGWQNFSKRPACSIFLGHRSYAGRRYLFHWRGMQ